MKLIILYLLAFGTAINSEVFEVEDHGGRLHRSLLREKLPKSSWCYIEKEQYLWVEDQDTSILIDVYYFDSTYFLMLHYDTTGIPDKLETNLARNISENVSGKDSVQIRFVYKDVDLTVLVLLRPSRKISRKSNRRNSIYYDLNRQMENKYIRKGVSVLLI